MVAAQYDDIFRIVALDERNVLIDGVGSSLVPRCAGSCLVRRKHVNPAVPFIQIPGLAVADVFI